MSDTVQPRDRTRTIDLQNPVSFGGNTYSAIDLRVPRIVEIKKSQTHLRAGAPDSDIKMMTVLVSLVSGLPEPAVDQVDFDIVMEAAEWLLSFTPKPQVTSET